MRRVKHLIHSIKISIIYAGYDQEYNAVYQELERS